MSFKNVLLSVACVVPILLTGCSSIIAKPPFTPSAAYDGKYRGTRVDVSNDAMCKETTITGTIVGGKVKFILTYNHTLLTGWVNAAGELKLSDDNTQWDYRFTGKVSGSKIDGKWSVDNAPCKGTWRVQKL